MGFATGANRRRRTPPLTTPTSPAPLFTPPPPPSRFQRVWRWALPTALAIIALALALGLFDTTGRPAWLFVIGVGFALLGVGSLLTHLVTRSREGLAVLEDKIEAGLGREEKK